MSYPRAEAQQVEWWVGQIEYARQKIKPRIEASQVLLKQFYNEAATEREEEALSDSFNSTEDIVDRTKSGIVYGFIDQSIANMVDRSPVFQCAPETQEAAKRIDPSNPNSLSQAQGAAKIVNYRYRETNQLRVDERVVQDAFIFPYGVAKLGYTIDFDKRFQDLFQPEDIDLVLDNEEEENVFLLAGTPTRITEDQDHRAHIDSHSGLPREALSHIQGAYLEVIKEGIHDHIKLHKTFLQRKGPSANTNVRYEAPFAVHWPVDMFLTDVMSLEGPQDARWVAFGWELPIEEVQADQSYSNTSSLEPSRWKDSPEKSQTLDSDGFDVIRGWEIWAKNFPVGPGRFEDRLLVIAEGHDKFLRNEKEWPYTTLDDYPAETLVFQPGFDSWHHKGPLAMGGADTVQALVNEILDSYLSIVRRQKNIWLVDKSAGMESSALTDIMSAPDGSIVEVAGLIEAAGKSIVPLPFTSIPPEKGELLGILQQMFDRSMGTPQPIALPQSDSATEASIMEKRNTARENRRSGLLSEFQVRKARKMWQLDAQYQPDRLFLLDPAAETFLSITPEVARGEYLFSMDVTSHATSLGMERSQWMDLLNLFAGLTPVMLETFGAPPNLPELARRLLVRGFDVKGVEEILPMLQKAADAMGVGGVAEGEGGVGVEGQIKGQGSGTTFADPAAQGAQEAVKDGRMIDRNIGPLDRDTFNRNPPSAGRLEGAKERV